MFYISRIFFIVLIFYFGVGGMKWYLIFNCLARFDCLIAISRVFHKAKTPQIANNSNLASQKIQSCTGYR